jgi:hypothetical protein
MALDEMGLEGLSHSSNLLHISKQLIKKMDRYDRGWAMTNYSSPSVTC